MWRHALFALLLAYAVAGTAWLLIYGPFKRTDWIEKSRPFLPGFIFAAALFVALGLCTIAGIGSGVAMARDSASQTASGLLVLVCSALSALALAAFGCLYLL